ncbi:hypothetical protein Tco_1246671 [Tanacetum coccineum]
MRDYLVNFEEYDGGNVLLGDGRECRIRGMELSRNLISLGTLKKEDFSVKMQSGKIKAVTKKRLKGMKRLGGYQTRWKIKTGNVLNSCNQRSTQQCTKSGVAKHLGVAVIQQQNGLVKETNMTLLAKVLQGVEVEVEPHEDHTFGVEPHGNVDHVVGSQEVQTQVLIYYHSARDREQHSAWELFSYSVTTRVSRRV